MLPELFSLSSTRFVSPAIYLFFMRLQRRLLLRLGVSAGIVLRPGISGRVSFPVEIELGSNDDDEGLCRSGDVCKGMYAVVCSLLKQ